MLILVCAKYYVLETKNRGDMTKFSELLEQPSYICYCANIKNLKHYPFESNVDILNVNSCDTILHCE